MFKVSLWLLVFMVFGMILIGGLTRLTGSGLSIVEWQPIMGILPPLNEADWHLLFNKYQASPEYQKINLGMPLQEFKNIFWLEYIHRVWGRVLGIILAIPLFLSFIKPQLKMYRTPLLFLAVLIGAQGFMGWYMVKSGLVDAPHVSPYRLTAHLLLGVVILATAFWMAQKTTCPDSEFIGFSRKTIKKISFTSFALLGFSVLTIVYGGLVAGHKAGLIYNTYPMMGDQWLPSELVFLSPFWKNIFANATTVQFIHRWLGTLTATLLAIFALSFWNAEVPNKVRMLIRLALGVALLQFALGLLTLLYIVPTDIALTHQGGALVLFLLIWATVLKTKPVWKK